MLPLYPVTPDTGGTVVVPRSHTSHHHLLDTHRGWAKQPDRDFCVLNKTDPMQVTISRLLGKIFQINLKIFAGSGGAGAAGGWGPAAVGLPAGARGQCGPRP